MNVLAVFIFAMVTPDAQAATAPGQPGYVAPELSVDLLRPSTDGTAGIAVDSACRDPGARGALLLSHGASPLVYSVPGQEPVAVVSGTTALWMTAAASRGPLRLGLTAPAYLRVSSELAPAQSTALGDPSLDLKLALLPEASPAPVGLGLLGRVVAPLGDEAAQVGQPGWTAEAGLAGDLHLGDWGLALNLLARLGEAARLGDADFGNGGIYRVGLRWAPRPQLDLGLEAFGQQAWSALLRFDRPASAELLVSGTWTLPSGLGLRAGLGRGMMAGPGSPDLRVLVGVQLSPPAPR